LKIRKRGIEIVEFDIQQTKDEEFVVYHDRRLSDSDYNINDCTLYNLKKEGQEKNFSFLTLEETLKIISEDFRIQIDVKNSETNIDKLLGIIDSFQISERIIASSFYPQIISKLSGSKIKKRWLLTSISRRRNPTHIFYALSPIRTAISCLANGIAPHQSLVTKKIIKKAHKKGLTVAIWTVNDKKLEKKFGSWGADYIIKDTNISEA